MAIYDVLGAKKAGLSDADIAEYLASSSEYDLAGARQAGVSYKDIISHLNKTGATPFETFTTAAKQAVGSEISGAQQLFGKELTPEQIAAESQVRQMTEENPVSGVLGTIAGGLVNPSSLIPGALFFKGAKGLVAGGAAAGSAAGALNPIYSEEDLGRVASTFVGAGFGTLLGGAAGLLARRGGGKVADEIAGALARNTTEETAPAVAKAAEVAGINPAEVVPTKSLQDSVVPWIQSIEDAEVRTQAGLDIANGDYRTFFTESPFRMSESPDFRLTNAFSADNPFREQNFEAYLKAGYKVEDPEKLLSRIAAANKAGITAELDVTPINIPADSAVNFLLNRKVQEIGGRDLMGAYLPELQRGVDMINSIDELFLNGRAAGMTDAEIAAVFKKDFDEVKPILFSAIGNVSNIGRALQAAKMQKRVLGSTEEIIKSLGRNNGQELNDILALKDAVSLIKNSPGTSFEKNKALADLVKTTVKEPNWKDKFGEYVVNSYISGLATPLVNAASGVAKLGLLSAERILQAANPFSKVKLGEVIPAFRGMMDGMLEGAYFAKEGFLRGSPLDAAMPEIKGAIGLQTGASKAERILGQVVRTPGRVGVGTDEFFKAIFRKMEYNAQAYRLASSGKYGDPDTVYNALRNVNTKASDWRDQVLKMPNVAALPDATRAKFIQDVGDFAKSATFQQDLGKFGRNVLRFRAQHPEMAWVVPFVKTPINIMKDALSYTPLGIFSKNTPNDVKVARTAIGASIAVGMSQLVGSNQITGSYPKDADKRNAMIAAGLPEYSVKIGDTWYSYARVEPLATVMGSTVDGINAVKNYYDKNPNDRKGKELALDVIGGITKNIASKTFLEGISGVLQAIHDPERYGGSFINSFAGLVVPSFVAAPARSADPNMRVVTDFGEAVQNRLPNLGQEFTRENLPAQSMIYGGLRPNPSYGLAAFTGIQTAPAEQSATQQEAARVKLDYTLPGKKLKGVELVGEDQAKYQALSSQRADVILASIMDTPGYQAAPDSIKKVILEKGMRRARTAATNILFGEKMQDPEFRAEYVRLKLKKKGIEEE
jgi:hypothetical protein